MGMHRTVFSLIAALSLVAINARSADKNQDAPQTWYFAVSGDSRNCGDVVMPAIAGDALKHDVSFYWHLGDLRLIAGPDQDFIEQRVRQGKPTNLAIYQEEAWDDFIENQVKPWGEVPFYLGIGNHEVIPPKTRAMFVERFHEYLNRPELREQRLKDGGSATEANTYFHWVREGVDFINLDNATADQFDSKQMDWLSSVLDHDRKDESIRTVVVGMHKALPESISFNHSMNESPAGTESGRQAYLMLLKLQQDSHKYVYVLASHSHFFMEGTYNTDYWRSNGGVVPGWIIGTAGAERYPLPDNAGGAKAAKTNVYGYLMATVNPEGEPPGTIKFKFEELKENDIPKEVVGRFTPKFVHECFVGNRRKIAVQ
jgi:calcineurin-like phosphoesterase family protein